MSNRMIIQGMRFVDHPQGDVTYGYTACDDHFSCYCSNWECEPPADGIELLEMMAESVDELDTAFLEALQHLQIHGLGLDINGIRYDYSEVAHVLNKFQQE